MIAVSLEGRLGNQLFQYAFIYAAAKKVKTSFYIDKSVDTFLLPKYFEVKNNYLATLDNRLFSIKGFKNIFNHHLRRAFYHSLKKALGLKPEIFSSSIAAALQMDKVKNGRLFEGYFQSEEYFLDYKDEIKKLFTIKNTYQTSFEIIFDSLPKGKKYIAVHVRRGDYTNYNLALPVSYYNRAISSIEHPENYYVFVSDDSDFVRREFAHITNKYVSENDEITDLQFLMHADTCILSNSSFSWWGAWLNKKNATVIAPQNWLGNEMKKPFPEGILQDDWTLIYDV